MELSQNYMEPLHTDLLKIKEDIADMWKVVYPVGAIYMSTSSTSPETLFGGGTWESFGAGRTLVGVDPSDADFNASNKTGGAKTHTLTRDQMPSHQHAFNMEPVGAAHSSGTARNVISGSAQKGSVTASGGGDPHNNMQPYITVYFWRRTA